MTTAEIFFNMGAQFRLLNPVRHIDERPGFQKCQGPSSSCVFSDVADAYMELPLISEGPIQALFKGQKLQLNYDSLSHGMAADTDSI